MAELRTPKLRNSETPKFQSMHITKTEALVLQQLAGASGSELYGLQMVKNNPALKMGTIYVILGRLEDKGFIESRREQLDTKSDRSVPRRLYRITALGARTFNAHNAYMASYEQEFHGVLVNVGI